MNAFKIAWRSIQHRGLGSLLTIVSMALGVMLVVAVLSIHGVVRSSFKSNNSFGYNVIVGARGGGLQLTLNTVYYLSQPVENIPYEYYLAFCDAETRERELKNSIAYQAYQEANALRRIDAAGMGGMSGWLTDQIADTQFQAQQSESMEFRDDGMYYLYTDVAVPMCLGDSYKHEETGSSFRCIGTKPNFFTDLVLDIDTEEKFEFAQGRNFVEKSPDNGYFECVIGATVARRTSLSLGDRIQATHGLPESASAHLHEQNYTIVGILAPTGTPNDRAVFLNMEGFYLMEDHAKPVENDSMLRTNDDSEKVSPSEESAAEPPVDPLAVADPFAEDETFEDVMNESPPDAKPDKEEEPEPDPVNQEPAEQNSDLNRIPLPIEQREVTAILVRTASEGEGALMLAEILPSTINEGDIETSLGWTPYRPERSQKAVQAVNPVMQVTSLFETIVDPVRWILLALTAMICIVSALSIVVGIYNSMNQRQHEIAVMRALGASRTRVMVIMLCESILLAVAGGALGWLAGHGLNAALSSVVADRTGVEIGFFSFAPPVELATFIPGLTGSIAGWKVSPELLLIPALILLAILVGLYPAVSAYKTDVSRSLGK